MTTGLSADTTSLYVVLRIEPGLHACQGLTKLLKPALNLKSSCLSHPSHWDYRYAPRYPAVFMVSQGTELCQTRVSRGLFDYLVHHHSGKMVHGDVCSCFWCLFVFACT
ncbi:uncharacterized protein LOC120889738 [Ictidomys tridecemlineatus]